MLEKELKVIRYQDSIIDILSRVFDKRIGKHIKKSQTFEKLQQADLDYSELIDLLIYSHIQGYEISKKYLNLKEFSNEEDELSIIREDFIESIKQFKNRYPKLYKEIEKKEKEHYFWIKKSNDLEITKKIQQEIIKGVEKGLDGYTIITNIGDLGDEYLVGSKENSNYWKTAIRQNIANAQATGNYTNLLEYQSRGIKYAKFDAVMDGRTTSTCSSLHGRIMKIEDFVLNGLVPPLHFGCRSALRPVNTNIVEDENGELRKHIKETTNEEIKHFKKHVQKGFGNPLNTVENVKKLVEDKEKKVYNSNIEISEKINKLSKEKKEIKENIKIAGVEKGNEMTHEEADSGNVNPNYLKNMGYQINCQSCVVTYEARLRGYDVEVLPNRKGSMLEKLSRQTNLAWIDSKTNKNPEYIYEKNKLYNTKEYIKYLNDTLKKGERYTIEFSWKGRSRAGHIVNIWKTENNEIVIYDPQINKKINGNKSISDYFKLIKFETTIKYIGKVGIPPKLLRIDNLEFNLDIVNEIMIKKEK